jgi:hypothetical protein
MPDGGRCCAGAPPPADPRASGFRAQQWSPHCLSSMLCPWARLPPALTPPAPPGPAHAWTLLGHGPTDPGSAPRGSRPGAIAPTHRHTRVAQLVRKQWCQSPWALWCSSPDALHRRALRGARPLCLARTGAAHPMRPCAARTAAPPQGREACDSQARQITSPKPGLLRAIARGA